MPEAEETTKITFKPLKGGWFKCNQTGDRVRAGQTKTYRRNKLGGRPKKDKIPPRPVREPVSSISQPSRRFFFSSSRW
ncbi:MAG: hypothetical protein PHZ04_05560 [Patescibacteria group bacterium]|nr:hypothetical protein [Patescibacteria group bacterium]MDD5294912.1 hypothetical protein [Patescibacteria group bacterium]MDD5554085.1 hypothetical protein [Patescibacteria group bacterium]